MKAKRIIAFITMLVVSVTMMSSCSATDEQPEQNNEATTSNNDTGTTTGYDDAEITTSYDDAEITTIETIATNTEDAKKVKQVALGGNHSACITENGSLYIWGDNTHGQLGNDTTEGSTTPLKIMDNVVSISLGYNHSAAITTDGSLYTWGHNKYGQLGNNTTEDSLTPVKIMDNVVSVSLGYDNSAAITTDGSLYTWGDNACGQLGNGLSGDETRGFDEGIDSSTPIKIMDNVASVSLGNFHSAAITTDGSLYTWGDGYNSQLGNGESGISGISLNPIKIMDNVTSVSLKNLNSAAITADGSLYTWGYNECGELGNGIFGEESSTPIKIMNDVISVNLGEYHIAAITTDGSLYTWGYNRYGQLGDGKTNDIATSTKIMDNVVSVGLGNLHSAAITTDGSLYTWGYNEYGQLGNGISGGSFIEFNEGIDSNTPVKIEIPTGESETTSTDQEKSMKDILSEMNTTTSSEFDASEYVGTYKTDDTRNNSTMHYSVSITSVSEEQYNIVINISNSLGSRVSIAEYTSSIDSNPFEFEDADGWGTNYYKIEFDDKKIYLSCENIVFGGGNWAIPKVERVEIPLM